MTTPRAEVATALGLFLEDGVDVLPYARNIPRPPRPTVMVRVDAVQPTPEARRTHRDYTYALVVLASSEDPDGAADDELDATLESVLDALDAGQAAEVLPRWDRAERAVYADTVPAYEVAITITHRKVMQ